ncbi:MAG: phosphoribosylglycinamide formyltransferase [Sphaerospermopsis sp. SIO1G2]|nr:phosphoribosylglycinamide formyltransferase [Sphaerospermopsis sp. SIO1G1]NET71806.1 phosphoribosylglycinamide formyltransferase [Sphaerospermopsis sp. SIO1G2]
MNQFDSIEDTPSLISPEIYIHNLPTTKPIKLGVMASGNGSNFEVISQAIANNNLNAKIQVLIYNNPHAQAAIKAQNYGVKSVLLNHRNYKTREDLDRQIIQTLHQHDVEYVIMAGWMRLVTQELIDAFPDKIVNIHPSLLPSFKGVKAVEQALTAGVKITGCTVHFVCLAMDSGPILMQAAVPILPNDTVETLHARIQVQEHRILPLAIASLAAK